jgi:hypothetical protein
MLTKKIILGILFLLVIKIAPCQIKDTIRASCFFDADSTYLGTFFSTNGMLDSTIYIDLEGNKLNVLFKLPQYRDGYGSLKLFLSDQFNKRVDYEEINGAALIYVLFKNKKIKEIRIGRRMGYNSKYDPIIKETFLKTERKWVVPKADRKKPTLFVYLFELK